MREKILDLIERNARITAHELAVMLGTSEDEIERELVGMEADHIICGYHTMINWEKTDREMVSALIKVKVAPQRDMGFDNIAGRIYQYPEVDAVYLMSGDFDFTVIIEGRTMREVAQFVSEKLSTMDSVLSTATHFVLKKYKDHGTILAEKKKEERMLVTP